MEKRLPSFHERARDPALTGGFFSVGYLVSKGTGKNKEEGFLKAFDIASLLQNHGNDLLRTIQEVTTSFNFERDMLEYCKSARMTKIVRAVDDGNTSVLFNGMPQPVFYLIFERADGDIRKVIESTGKVEDGWKLKHLHDVAVGVQQLHINNVSHQDLKPSNVLIFETKKEGAKIGDLGRASRNGLSSAHDGCDIVGARAYAPPEQLYGHTPDDWILKRELCDLYHLGSLIVFLFTGSSTNNGLFKNLPVPLHFNNWRGKYEDVLPYLVEAFSAFLEELQYHFPEWARDDLTLMVKQMCHPDYKNLRGDPYARRQTGNPVGIDRFVSKLDLLTKRAAIEARS